jgi:lipopolysaccharide transport system ATP-binding protein
MSDTVISVENVSKIYRLGEVGTGSLAHDVNRWWHRVRGKEDPYLKVGKINERTQSAGKPSGAKRRQDDWVYALKDVSFDIKQGEVLGIIGRNGAGKSTILKILSRVTSQTTGSIKLKGRIASLLEVGTGFHPELTGRENIFLNGAILGMRKQEIASKLDEIVDFSGCARYIDTPVKRYSSGMYVRLAFAVAAHLDPEILVVDEVLAVGDAEFQKKCIGKMKSASEQHGKTILFVSHDLESISKLTRKSILLSNGKVAMYADTQSVIREYLDPEKHFELEYVSKKTFDQPHIRSVKLHTSHPGNIQHNSDPLKIEIEVFTPQPIKGAFISFQVVDSKERNFIHLHLSNSEQPFCSTPGIFKLSCHISKLRLYLGDYKLKIFFSDSRGNEMLETISGICPFKVTMFQTFRPEYPWQPEACAYVEDSVWEIKKI